MSLFIYYLLTYYTSFYLGYLKKPVMFKVHKIFCPKCTVITDC